MKLHQSLTPSDKYDINVCPITNSSITSNNASLSSVHEAELKEPFFKCRHVVALFGFGVLLFFGIHGINMPVSIVAMVNNTALLKQNRSASESCPLPLVDQNATTAFVKKEGEFNWSSVTQGYIHSSNFAGYMSTLLLSGKAAERFGCKWVIFWGVFLSSLCSLLTPYASWWNVNALIVIQAVRGMAQGSLQPAISVLAANWLPRHERVSLGTFMQIGQVIGVLVGGVGSGYLCDSSLFGGWPSVFYIFGLTGVLLSVLIALFFHECPSVHPSISKAELTFILDNQENPLSQKRPDVPWRSIFTSAPFYALCVALFGEFWLNTHFVVVHPTFLGSVLHFPIEQNGMLSSMPCILRVIYGVGGGWISSFLNRRKYVGVDKNRKLWNSIACVGYSVGLLGVIIAGCNKMMSITFSVIFLASEGFVIPGCLIAPTDMSPTFAGTIMALGSTFASTASLIFPLVVGYFTNEDQSLEQWNKIFFITIGVVMASGIVFAVFGSADVQPWNFVQDNNDEEKPVDLKVLAESGGNKVPKT